MHRTAVLGAARTGNDVWGKTIGLGVGGREWKRVKGGYACLEKGIEMPHLTP